MNSSPAMTSTSLLASRIFLPRPAAASVGSSPAAPTMAAITVSTSGCAAIVDQRLHAVTHISLQPGAVAAPRQLIGQNRIADHGKFRIELADLLEHRVDPAYAHRARTPENGLGGDESHPAY
jgi:hypothetical protein